MVSLSPKSLRSVRRFGLIGGVIAGACVMVLGYSAWLGSKNKEIQVEKFSLKDQKNAAALKALAGRKLAPVKNAAPAAGATALARTAPTHPGSNVDGIVEASVGLPGARAGQKRGSAAMVPGSQAAPGAKGAAMNVPSDPDADFGITTQSPSQYSYNPDGRRDPFRSLLRGEFESEHGDGGQPLVDVADLRLMGVLRRNNEYFAMVEDSKHHGFTLRAGDPVLNGRVAQIEHDCITVNLSSYGESQTVKLHLNNATQKAGE